MKALNDFIVLQKEKIGPKKVKGLILTEDLDVDNRYIKGKVVSFGNLTEGVKEGDIVYYDKNAANGMDYKEEIYYIIRARDIVPVE